VSPVSIFGMTTCVTGPLFRRCFAPFSEIEPLIDPDGLSFGLLVDNVKGMGGQLALRAVGFAVAVAVAACATGNSNVSGGSDAGEPDLLGDGATACTGLACRQINCASQGLHATSLNGIVYDPAGATPLYNVFVYVPSHTPDPLTPGQPRCAPCQADASGNPLVSTSTDALGWFHLDNVPAGDNVPLVLQVGKWRRQIVVPHVDACVDNTLLNPDLVRLPAKASEGDMPLMALTTGCDAIECFLQSVGIDPSEFTGPSGPGHVHVYAGHYAGMTVPAMGDAYSLWASPDKLAQYDMVLGACECSPYPRDTEGPAYAAMQQYLDTGGRFFSTHFHYNWFAPPTGPTAFQSVATWGSGDESLDQLVTYYLDTTFPKGHAFADWLEGNALSAAYGQVDLSDARDSVEQVVTATRWIYGGPNATSPNYEAKYMSFDTPLSVAPASQCGRAMFSDVHVSGTSDAPGPFPAECEARSDPHATNERALEFLFFDLVSCVQDESQPPTPPTTH
jgi:hypothetical protein